MKGKASFGSLALRFSQVRESQAFTSLCSAWLKRIKGEAVLLQESTALPFVEILGFSTHVLHASRMKKRSFFSQLSLREAYVCVNRRTKFWMDLEGRVCYVSEARLRIHVWCASLINCFRSCKIRSLLRYVILHLNSYFIWCYMCPLFYHDG